jgi:protein SCO1/2
LLFGHACRREEPLERLWVAPTFALIDQQGRPFGSADVAGRAALLSFVYTHCTDTCPLLTATMSQVQDRLRTDGLLGSRGGGVRCLDPAVDASR